MSLEWLTVNRNTSALYWMQCAQRAEEFGSPRTNQAINSKHFSRINIEVNTF